MNRAKKNSLRTLISVCLALCLILGVSISASAAGNAVSDARNGVARVIATYKDGSMSLGSSFGVGAVAGAEADYFVTNRHVVEYAQNVFIVLDDEAYNPTFGLQESHLVRCDVTYVDDGSGPDLAVLKPSAPVGRVVLPLMENEEQNLVGGDAVYVLGYPGSSEVTTVDNNGDVQSLNGSIDSITITSGVVSKYVNFTSENNTRIIEHDADVNHGDSGGPLINADGVVVGVNTWGYGEDLSSGDSSHYGSIKIDYVIDILDNLKISYATAGAAVSAPEPTVEPTAEPAPEPTVAPTAEPIPEPTAEPAPEPAGPNMTIIIAAVAAVVVVAIVVAIVLITNGKKKKAPAPAAPVAPAAQTAAPPQTAAPQQPGQTGFRPAPVTPATGGGSSVKPAANFGETMILKQPAATALLVNGGTITRVKNGESVNITSDNIIIGRDDTADLWIKDNPYIGTRHVRLNVHGGETFITDLNSKNGTFLNGKKIPANTETKLDSGVKITLANEDFTFKK